MDSRGKLVGLGREQLRGLGARPGLWLVVEADGAAGRPLKGWAEHEPVWPEWTGCAVVVVGASGLGRPLSGDSVHRPQRFAAASGLALGEPVTPAALAGALRAWPGPLAGLSPGAERVLVLNQVETLSPQDLAAARRELSGLEGLGRLLTASLERGRVG
jgi:probable selenium-dependent hydroxylase accessory protein YqeC